MRPKFSAGESSPGRDAPAFSYGDVWQRKPTSEGERLVIGPSAQHVDLLLRLARFVPGPYGILYVLLLSRRGDHTEGRYQCPRPVDLTQLADFFSTYRSFLEGDGRHHVWIMSVPTSALLVYDHHDVIYAYGPLDAYEQDLQRAGFTAGSVSFPVPHTHHYLIEFDDTEQQILQHWPWKHFPLRPEDDH